MYTIKTLSAINPNYCYSHKVTQVDVDNVNAMVEAIEKEREGAITPQVGDMNTALRDMVGMSIPSCPARCRSLRMVSPSTMAATAATEKWRKSRKPDREKGPHGFFHVGLLSFLREPHKKFT